MIKGIQSPKDAKKCVQFGVDGIVVSNHAGRQVDGAVGSLDALEWIVDAVGEEIYVMFDSGVRGAADVVKAVAIGARFVFVGRLWVWGLAIMGEDGARHVMKSLLAELDILMAVAGLNSLEELDRSLLGGLSCLRLPSDGWLTDSRRIRSEGIYTAPGKGTVSERATLKMSD